MKQSNKLQQLLSNHIKKLLMRLSNLFLSTWISSKNFEHHLCITIVTPLIFTRIKCIFDAMFHKIFQLQSHNAHWICIFWSIRITTPILNWSFFKKVTSLFNTVCIQIFENPAQQGIDCIILSTNLFLSLYHNNKIFIKNILSFGPLFLQAWETGKPLWR